MKRFVNKVEIYLGPSLGWVDITADVRGTIGITRGRTTEGGRADRGRCTLRLAAETGKYSPRNPAGPWYGLIGRNTPLRVSGGRVGGALVGRFYGEVSEWPLRSTLRGNVRHVDVQAVGILQRLGQGTPPKQSPMRRTVAVSSPVAYWPGEDGATASAAGAALSGAAPLAVSGSVTFAQDAEAFGSPGLRFGTSALGDLAAGGSLSATLDPAATAATAAAWTVYVFGRFDIQYVDRDMVLLEWSTPGGTYVRWQLVAVWATTHTQVIAYTAAGTPTVVADRNGVYGGLRPWAVSAVQSGGNIDITYWASDGEAYGSTKPGQLAGVSQLIVNPSRVTATQPMPFGHVTVWPAGEVPFPVSPEGRYDDYGYVVFGPTLAYGREAAADRLARLCAEEDVSLAVTAPPATLVSRMAWQPVAAFLDLVDECVDVDGGYLYEQRDALGLAYRTRASLYKQTAVPIAYVGQLGDPFEPVDDANDVRNDVTVKRDGGSSARAVLSSGPNSVLAPPAGVGRVATEVTLNLMTDDQLGHHAWWRVHLGTQDQPRYPSLTVQLASPEWQAAPAALDALLAVDTGDVLEVTGLPAWAAGDARTMVLGYSEDLTEETWEITYSGVPAQPWDVATVDGPARVAMGPGGTLADPVAAGGLSLSLATTAASGLWTTKPGSFPLDLRVGEEQIRVSAITGAASPQTATVSARGLNGITAAWPAGTKVEVWRPAIVAL